MSLAKIQSELKVPKGNFNKFGNYKYRNAEDILSAVKPLLAKYGYHLNIKDEIKMIGIRYYVVALVTIFEGDKVIATSTAYAREAENKKGMDDAQITGSASSYSRKYALNAIFAIDDGVDPDMTNKHGKDQPTPQANNTALTNYRNIINKLIAKHGLDDKWKGWETVKDPMQLIQVIDHYEAIEKQIRADKRNAK